MQVLPVLCLFISVLRIVKGYPAVLTNVESSTNVKQELRYPNGTVIGRYAYTDDNGNPIEVKYFADDASFGIELNSIKVVDNMTDSNKKQVMLEKFVQSPESAYQPQISQDTSIANPVVIKHKTNDFQSLYRDFNSKHSHKTNPEYEIYLKADMNTPKRCNKEKVRVYNNYGKEKRKVRHTYSNYADTDASKYCRQF